MNRNKVLDLGPGIDKIGYTPTSGGYNLGSEYMFLEVGQPFGQMKGYKFLGLWGSDEDARSKRVWTASRYRRNMQISMEMEWLTEKTKQHIGYGYPDFTFGWTNLFTYNNFELSFLVTGSYGNELFNTIRIRRQTYEATDPIVWDYWTPENQDTDIPAHYDGAWVEAQHLTNKYVFGNVRRCLLKMGGRCFICKTEDNNPCL